VIESGLKTFWQVGEALAKVRDGKLYKAEYGTFEDYCLKRWQMARPTAYQFIEAAAVRENLSAMADTPPMSLPKTERQVRPLTSLPPEQQKEAWNESLEATGGMPTGKDVQAAAHARSVLIPEIATTFFCPAERPYPPT
jgi:hypothetical protein